MKTIEVYYDFSSPYTYLAVTQLPALAERHGATIAWKPILLGAIFKMQNWMPPATNQNKGRWMFQDLQRWSDRYGLALKFPSRFPMNSINAERLMLALGAEDPKYVELLTAIFKAYWEQDRDISDKAVLQEIADEVGLDGAALVEKTQDPAVKQALKDLNEEANNRGVFGAPSMFVDDTMHFGNDRLDFVEEALKAG